jgi:hypothetical protein
MQCDQPRSCLLAGTMTRITERCHWYASVPSTGWVSNGAARARARVSRWCEVGRRDYVVRAVYDRWRSWCPALCLYSCLSQMATVNTRIMPNSELYCGFDLLRHSGHCMYGQFNMHKVYVLPTLFMCIYHYQLQRNKANV